MERTTRMWTHGNALTVETPSDLDSISHRGWGTDLFIKGSTSTWFHLPIPTPASLLGDGSELVKVFLLFECQAGEGIIAEVHLYDGAFDFQAFHNLELEGSHRTPDGTNTFVLQSSYFMRSGLGLTFRFQSAHGIDSQVGPFWLSIVAAGGEFLAVAPSKTIHER